MSRPISYTSAVTVNPISFDADTWGSYYSGATSGYNGTTNTTQRAQFRLRTTGQTCYYGFSIPDIPSIATINSVSCQVKGYVSSASYYPSVQLYSNTTKKGSATNITSTNTGNIVSLTTGTWSLPELSSAKLCIKTERGSTGGNTRYFYFYGADLTINYSVNGIEYSVTINNSTTITTEPTGTTYVFENNNQEINFNTTDVSNLTITDNGNLITPLPVYEFIETATTFIVSTYDTGKTYSSTSSSNQTNGCNGTTNTTFATLAGGSRTQYYYYYGFSVNGIPNNAKILNTKIDLKGCKFSTYAWDARFCVDTNPVVSETITATTSNSSAPSIDDAKILTLQTDNIEYDDLNNIELCLYPTTGSSNIRLFFYGADLTIDYSIPGTGGTILYYSYTISSINSDHVISVSEKSSSSNRIYHKENGWIEYKKVYKKVENDWVEQTISTDLFDSGTIYMNK